MALGHVGSLFFLARACARRAVNVHISRLGKVMAFRGARLLDPDRCCELIDASLVQYHRVNNSWGRG